LSLLSNTNLGFFICKKCKLHFENEIYRSLREHDQVLKRISMTILPLKVNIKRRNGNLELWTVDRNKDFLYLVENDLRIRVLSSVDDLVKFVSLKDLSILNENQFTLDRMLEISKQIALRTYDLSKQCQNKWLRPMNEISRDIFLRTIENNFIILSSEDNMVTSSTSTGPPSTTIKVDSFRNLFLNCHNIVTSTIPKNETSSSSSSSSIRLARLLCSVPPDCLLHIASYL